jgi:hypothetical protein
MQRWWRWLLAVRGKRRWKQPFDVQRSSVQRRSNAHLVANFPEMDASSAVYPTVRPVGDTLNLAYYLPGCADSAVVSFHGVTNWRYDEPNDEGLAAHPLWTEGVGFYGFYEIGTASSEGVRRWVATFHDGTLYVDATDEPAVLAALIADRPPWKALDAVLGDGANQVLR